MDVCIWVIYFQVVPHVVIDRSVGTYLSFGYPSAVVRLTHWVFVFSVREILIKHWDLSLSLHCQISVVEVDPLRNQKLNTY